MADGLTKKMCQEASGGLSFAKLLIEVDVDVDNPLPDELFIHIPHEDFLEPVEVAPRVEYPWHPSWCDVCSIFGHNIHNCPVIADIQEKKLKEDSEAKKREQEKDDFITMQRKCKEKMSLSVWELATRR